MEENWSQKKLQQFIDEGIEESLTLEYKGADALQRTDSKKREITKDVSAMANADGGTLIYGVKEYDEKVKRHLPHKIDAIDRSQYSKEWLEHVISNIRPRINNIIIHSVELNSGMNDVAYVIEILKSDTAHQATDHRYYLRYNFESVAMEDYQIRDIMHRGIKPDATVKFKPKLLRRVSDGKTHKYLLQIFIENHGIQVVDHFQLIFSVPQDIPVNYNGGVLIAEHITVNSQEEIGGLKFSYRSIGVLFPEEEREIATELDLQYTVNNEVYHKIRMNKPTLNWKLYADNMTPKEGQIPFSELNNF